MSASKGSPTSRERFDQYLRSNHKRRTAERFAILEQVSKTQGHFSADELGEQLRAEGYPVSCATVYSTLELLVDCGLVARQRFSDKGNLYEKASTTATVHHHLVCTVCGKIKEVRDQTLTELIECRSFTGFTPSYYFLNIYGTCAACARRRRRGKSSDKKK